MTTVKTRVDLDRLKYDDRGLIPMVVQDIASGTVLMVGWSDRQALERTLETGRGHFYSRSRQQLWRKGETSGNELVARELLSDCDRDTILLRVDPLGPTCHTGLRSCFEADSLEVASQLELGWLEHVIALRAQAGDDSSYTASLLASGLPRVAQKVGEEAVETVIAAMKSAGSGAGDDAATASDSTELVEETADLVFHLLVLLQAKNVRLADVAQVLRDRHQKDLGRDARAGQNGEEP